MRERTRAGDPLIFISIENLFLKIQIYITVFFFLKREAKTKKTTIHYPLLSTHYRHIIDYDPLDSCVRGCVCVYVGLGTFQTD